MVKEEIELPTKTAIDNLIFDTLREMILIYKNGGYGKKWNNIWRDVDNEQGLVISAEALYCFLVSSLTIPEMKEKIFGKKGIFNKNILEKTLDDIINFSSEDFYGSPYINFEEFSKDMKDRGFMDAACFVTSDIYALKKTIWSQLDDSRKKKLDDLFEKSLTFINESYIENDCFSWGTFQKPKEGFVYSTYMAFETIDDFFDNKYNDLTSNKARILIKDLIDKIPRVTSYFEKKYIISPEHEQKDITKKTLSLEGPRDTKLHYNLWITLCLLTGKSKKLDESQKAIEIILKYFNKEEHSYLRETESFWFDTKELNDDGEKTIDKASFEDRAFLPLLLKALCVYIKEFPEKYDNFIKIISVLYEKLLGAVDKDKYLFVWDKYAEADSGYALYYTERSIEALCMLYKILPADSVKKSQPVTDLSLGKALEIIIKKLDFSTQIENINKQMLELQDEVNELQKENISILNNRDISASEKALEIKEIDDKINSLMKDDETSSKKILEIVENALKRYPNNKRFLKYKKELESGINDAPKADDNQ